MKKQNIFTGFLLIGIGCYFFLQQFQIPFFTDFYSWPTLLMIIGIVFLFHSYFSKEYKNLFPGTILLGLGLHFFGLRHYGFWIDHWGVYPLIIGIAFLIRFQKTKSGLLPGLLLLGIALFAIYSINKPGWFNWINETASLLESFWPLLLIAIGGYLIYRKK
ncbi:hypothetical protein ERJ70_12200 [Sediminibacillus dalangtanensis]|uniref:LiaI-LiaF-like transmembrane region domain-containing protein n=1 Tax=Sediminibacillus dalangtanensis TaxID=2729421 RepID=A0ABX7VZR3_9BACI|nr:DUF5668 domain-containing protein [Sediminibacillus dalangtanensis]QTM99987.1 hypothetical protein ERJ70_12200 [Sediminibacillus dalangtanensis]